MGFNSVTLTPEQVEALNRSFSTMRHDINNFLSLMVAASELIKFSPGSIEQMSKTLSEQPPKISASIAKFADELEKALGIARR